MSIVVVGAGISGLSAAWTLDRAGAEVTVLEAADRPGGRMRSLPMAGTVMELGAQFLSSAYDVVPQLARTCGLQLLPVPPGGAVVRDGALHPFRSDRPSSFFTGGTLPWSAAPAAGVGLIRLRAATKGRALHDLPAWADLDEGSGEEWARRTLGTPMADRFLASVVNGFYFQSLAESGAPLAAAVAGFGAAPAKTLTIAGGLGRLTAALAERLEVRYRTAVRRVDVVDGGPRVLLDDGSLLGADRVVLAVPGPVAERLLATATAIEAELVATPYSRGLLVGYAFDRPLAAEALAGAYGVLVDPREDTLVAALAVASRSHRGSGDVLTVMLSDSAAADQLPSPDAAVSGLVRAELDLLAPGLPAHTAAHVVRWPAAMPTVPPGHARRVRTYTEGLAPDAPVVLAGDYLGFPWSDSAASTGRWAAGHVLEGLHARESSRIGSGA